MLEWEEIKNRLDSISENGKEELNIIAEIVTKVVIRRNELGLSQRALADKIGIKQSALARFEKQGVVPKLNTVLKILKALGLKLEVVNVIEK